MTERNTHFIDVNGTRIDTRTTKGPDPYLDDRLDALAKYLKWHGAKGYIGRATAAKLILEMHLPDYEHLYKAFYTGAKVGEAATEEMLRRQEAGE